MKKILLAFTVLLAFGTSYGQGSLTPGKAQLNLGLGFSSWGVPVYLGIDYGASRDITVGGELSVRSYREDWRGNHDYYKSTITGISGNVNYHFNRVLEIPKDFDFYAGLNVGFYVWSLPAAYDGTHSSGLGLGGQVGGRYYFTNKFGLNLEFGGNNAFGNGKIGVTFKL
ncbi:hypothetical protein [Parasediminibacterium sp. JCM 36343]|uniref:hypothetical protein n=1 Tax=Parasediminibacterium sp. JCM 36343 TaxID=3374279 RepID=UPI00397B7A49